MICRTSNGLSKNMETRDAPLETAEPGGIRPSTGAGFKARLQRAIGAAESAELIAALDALWQEGGFAVRRPPESGLLMATVHDPFDTDFLLGEVLVTQAAVDFEGHAGYGTMLDDAPEGALLLAAVDALERSGCTSRLASLTGFFETIAERDRRSRMRESRLAGSTVVRFETMQKERIDLGSLGE